MVLTKKEILERIAISDKHTYKFIDPVNISNIKSASYDLTLGDEYYICSDTEAPDIKRLAPGEDLIVPPRATFFVISRDIHSGTSLGHVQLVGILTGHSHDLLSLGTRLSPVWVSQA